MEIRYRPHRPDDFPQIRRIWQEASGWGAMTEAFWRRHVVDAPDGGPFICLATDADDVVLGGIAFQRRRFWLDGQPVRAARPLAPIVSDALRKRVFSINPVDHPVVQMTRFTERFLREEGFALSYMLPDPHWRLLFRMMPRIVSSTFPLWSRPLPLPAPLPLPGGHTAEPFDDFGAPLDALWDRAKGRIACGRMRDSAGMRAHAGPDEYDLVGVRRDGEWVGLVAARQKGDRQWLVCDLLAVDDAAQHAALAAAVNRADALARSGEAGPLGKVALLVAPMLADTVSALGFARDRYDFTLVVRVLDDRIARASVDASRWYLSANE